jgi:H-type small acid-soluble spore protein
MDVQRAQEIIASERIIPVMNQGVPVWIESVDAIRGTASVHEENNKLSKKTVSVQELTELQ